MIDDEERLPSDPYKNFTDLRDNLGKIQADELNYDRRQRKNVRRMGMAQRDEEADRALTRVREQLAERLAEKKKVKEIRSHPEKEVDFIINDIFTSRTSEEIRAHIRKITEQPLNEKNAWRVIQILNTEVVPIGSLHTVERVRQQQRIEYAKHELLQFYCSPEHAPHLFAILLKSEELHSSLMKYLGDETTELVSLTENYELLFPALQSRELGKIRLLRALAPSLGRSVRRDDYVEHYSDRIMEVTARQGQIARDVIINGHMRELYLEKNSLIQALFERDFRHNTHDPLHMTASSEAVHMAVRDARELDVLRAVQALFNGPPIGIPLANAISYLFSCKNEELNRTRAELINQLNEGIAGNPIRTRNVLNVFNEYPQIADALIITIGSRNTYHEDVQEEGIALVRALLSTPPTRRARYIFRRAPQFQVGRIVLEEDGERGPVYRDNDHKDSLHMMFEESEVFESLLEELTNAPRKGDEEATILREILNTSFNLLTQYHHEIFAYRSDPEIHLDAFFTCLRNGLDHPDFEVRGRFIYALNRYCERNKRTHQLRYLIRALREDHFEERLREYKNMAKAQSKRAVEHSDLEFFLSWAGETWNDILSEGPISTPIVVEKKRVSSAESEEPQEFDKKQINSDIETLPHMLADLESFASREVGETCGRLLSVPVGHAIYYQEHSGIEVDRERDQERRVRAKISIIEALCQTDSGDTLYGIYNSSAQFQQGAKDFLAEDITYLNRSADLLGYPPLLEMLRQRAEFIRWLQWEHRDNLSTVEGFVAPLIKGYEVPYECLTRSREVIEMYQAIVHDFVEKFELPEGVLSGIRSRIDRRRERIEQAQERTFRFGSDETQGSYDVEAEIEKLVREDPAAVGYMLLLDPRAIETRDTGSLRYFYGKGLFVQQLVGYLKNHFTEPHVRELLEENPFFRQGFMDSIAMSGDALVGTSSIERIRSDLTGLLLEETNYGYLYTWFEKNLDLYMLLREVSETGRASEGDLKIQEGLKNCGYPIDNELLYRIRKGNESDIERAIAQFFKRFGHLDIIQGTPIGTWSGSFFGTLSEALDTVPENSKHTLLSGLNQEIRQSISWDIDGDERERIVRILIKTLDNYNVTPQIEKVVGEDKDRYAELRDILDARTWIHIPLISSIRIKQLF